MLIQELKEKLKLKIEYYNQNSEDGNSSEDFDEMFKEDDDALISIEKLTDISKSTLSNSQSNINNISNDKINVDEETNKINKKSNYFNIFNFIAFGCDIFYNIFFLW